MADLSSYLVSVRNNTIAMTKQGCVKSIADFGVAEAKKNLDEFINESKQTINNQDKETADLIKALESVKTDLALYNEKLVEELRKASDKGFLKSNLFLMIATIGLFSIGAIALVRWFPREVMNEWVESGQVIQFVTVMILLSVIMSLGLVGLLSENTLGTLLGGIGGYVLSQGVGRSAARRALREKETQDLLQGKKPE